MFKSAKTFRADKVYFKVVLSIAPRNFDNFDVWERTL